MFVHRRWIDVDSSSILAGITFGKNHVSAIGSVAIKHISAHIAEMKPRHVQYQGIGGTCIEKGAALVDCLLFMGGV